MDCHICGDDERFSRRCSYCDEPVCRKHHLPEKHDCRGVKSFNGGKRFQSAMQVKQETATDSVPAEPVDSSPDQLETKVVDDRTPIEPSEGGGGDLGSGDDELPPPGECEDCDAPDGFTYSCNYCGDVFCPRHRLPEQHNCPGINNGIPPKPAFENTHADGTDGQSYESVDLSPGQTHGGIPEKDEVIDDSSPDVALDGSIAGEESEPLGGGEDNAQPSGWLSTKSLIAVVVLVVALGVAAFVLL